MFGKRYSLSLSILAIAYTQGILVAQTLVEFNPCNAPVSSQVIALTGAKLIDGAGGEPIDNSTILIQFDKILAAGPSSSVTIPADADRIVLNGKTVIPGFVDCHFHSINDTKIVDTFLRNGVTSFRDPGHPFKYYKAVRETTEPMPRVFLTGGHIDASPPIWPDQAEIANSAEEAAAIVSEHRSNGATAIKIYFRTPLEHYRAICKRAKREGIVVTAHLELVKATDAISAGVDGVEHVTSFGTALAEDEHVKNFVGVVSQDPAKREELRYRMWSKIDFDDNPRLESLIQQVVDAELFLSPTLAVFERRSKVKDTQDYEVLGFANMLEFIRRCHAAKATIVAGSHTWVPGADLGWAFQRELELLVECGLTPLEAITAGTLNGARFLKAEQRLGTIEPGKLADLLILGNDPTKDISATRDIEGVMLNGAWIVEP